MNEPIVLSHFMEVVRSRWNFEECEFDAIEDVMLDPECRVALLSAASGDLRERINRDELVKLIEDLSSVNLTPGAVKRQGSRIADAILASLPGRDDEAIRAEERERCAKIAERYIIRTLGIETAKEVAVSDTARRIAAAILKTESGS